MTTRTDTPAPIVERPGMAAGYGIKPADPEKMLAWATVEAKLAAARNYWVCTARPDGRPHVAPIWGLWRDGALHFGTDPASRKARNLAANPELAVHLESGDDVVILEGAVELTEDPALIASIWPAYGEKYAMPQADLEQLAAMPSAIYRFRPRLAFAWLESSFPDTATRFRFP
jgi:hypothetical protein